MDIDGIGDRYRRHSRMAEGFARGKLRGDPVYAAVFPYLQAGSSVLDVGCGEGYLLALAASVGCTELVGLDHDPRRMDQGRVALDDLGVRWLEGDVRQVELPPSDVVTCLDVLHYMPPEAQDAVIQRLSAAVRPGGVLLLRDGRSDAGWRSTVTALSERVAMALGRHRGDGVFFRPAGALKTSLEAAGLRVEAAPCRDGTPFANELLVARPA